MIMTHSDNKGLVLPPKAAPKQVGGGGMRRGAFDRGGRGYGEGGILRQFEEEEWRIRASPCLPLPPPASQPCGTMRAHSASTAYLHADPSPAPPLLQIVLIPIPNSKTAEEVITDMGVKVRGREEGGGEGGEERGGEERGDATFDVS